MPQIYLLYCFSRDVVVAFVKSYVPCLLCFRGFALLDVRTRAPAVPSRHHEWCPRCSSWVPHGGNQKTVGSVFAWFARSMRVSVYLPACLCRSLTAEVMSQSLSRFGRWIDRVFYVCPLQS